MAGVLRNCAKALPLAVMTLDPGGRNAPSAAFGQTTLLWTLGNSGNGHLAATQGRSGQFLREVLRCPSFASKHPWNTVIARYARLSQCFRASFFAQVRALYTVDCDTNSGFAADHRREFDQSGDRFAPTSLYRA